MTLRSLFLDMNSYFASVEQQMRPELRCRPIAVVPVLADTTCCIAASYEAKKFGIKTGTRVRDAKRMCRKLQIVEARPRLYVEVHHQILKAVDSCIPVSAVLSIDEMECRLWDNERTVDDAVRLAKQIKEAIRRDVGEFLRCSIGLAPNRLLAKVAADWQKPDGLTIVLQEELPQRLFELPLRAFPGIGPRMEQRLLKAGIKTTQQFCEQTPQQLAKVWGSKLLGAVWWRRLRGEDIQDPPTHRRTVGHSHVLPPELRNEKDAKAVMLRLIDKAAARLRKIDYWAGAITVRVDFFNDQCWQAQQSLSHCQDTTTLIRAAGKMWKEKPPGTPLKIGITLSDLVSGHNVAQPLFDEDRKLNALSAALDEVKQRFGPQSIIVADMRGSDSRPVDPKKAAVPTRIAFNHIPDISNGPRRMPPTSDQSSAPASRELLEQMAALMDSSDPYPLDEE
ncbi:MAG: DNA polymerase [Planctomycetaceae bacterium]|nr:DNA polymerase [Planctomycetaceae bacterium]